VLPRKNAKAAVTLLEIGLCGLSKLNAFIILVGLSFLHRMFYWRKGYENYTVAY
jgi:hypothetical protein